ncbi:uncharacterized protein LOC129250474 [Anastrepha obliqua]|uniref:uncharacterized protein LOC129250474 n=1 Tax=Anastrepha obliqua TaxID=95512 RepID=UPI00240A909A|nr:uncharacterized protein LOC129250474 [Anastrepha obliqua]
MKILQLNTNHCREAQDLLWLTLAENNVDVALLSEPYEHINSHSWMSDSERLAAIWVVTDKFPQCKKPIPDSGDSWMKLDSVYCVSCYAPPRWPLETFARMMTVLELELRGKRPILVTGEYNAWSRTWGSMHTSPRGRLVEETFAAMDLVLRNTPRIFTFDSCRGRSIIDLAFADRVTANRAKWRIEKFIHTQSDHLAIIIEIQEDRRNYERWKTLQKWKKTAFNAGTFRSAWDDAYLSAMSADGMGENMAAQIKAACDASMPRCRYGGKRKPTYWWTAEIADMRKACFKARRRATRARQRPTFKQMRDGANTDPWGQAYKTVMQKMKGPRSPQPTCPQLLQQIIVALFLAQGEASDAEYGIDAIPNVQPVTPKEVLNTLKRVKDCKAPGPDGVPNIALKTPDVRKPIPCFPSRTNLPEAIEIAAIGAAT